MMIFAIGEWLAWSGRHKALRAIVRRTIEGEGGELVGISIVGFLLRSPFPPINLRPVYLKATCRYPEDSGIWYICGTDGGETCWAWSSDSGAVEPPIGVSRPVKVDNSVVALSPWLSILLCVAFFSGTMGCIMYLCIYL